MASDESIEKDPQTQIDTACCKVSRTANEFGISHRLSELVSLRKEGKSFRKIAKTFNTWVVQQAIESVDIGNKRSVHAALVGGDIADTIYSILEADSDSDVRQSELRARLNAVNIDIERLESSFVSHVTIRSHLQECVGVTPEQSPPPFEKIINTTQRAKVRAENIIQSTLKRAINHDQIHLNSLRVEVLVKVSCDDCGETFYLTELLDRRRCACTREEE